MHSLLLVTGTDIDGQMLPFFDHLDVEPYEGFLSEKDIAAMAEQYRIAVADLDALAEKMDDWMGEEGFVRGGRLGMISRSNPKGKFDWYEVGGRFAGYLHLKEPKPPTFVGRLLGRGAVVKVNTALKREVHCLRILADPPVALLHEGLWIELPILNPVEEAWKREFAAAFKEIADDVKLTVVDVHT